MYLYGKLEIDPSQMTLIKKVNPTGVFTKLLDALTFGKLSDKQEHETFTALSILQQLSLGMRAMNIHNVIRLAIDEYDFYFDHSGVEDDLNQAMFELKSKIDPLESEIFKTIYMVLEHESNDLKYVIEIGVERKHKVGEYPIKIIVNGVISELKLNNGESRDELIERMRPLFANQKSYDEYINTYQTKFNEFLYEMDRSIRKVIRVDDIQIDSAIEIIRPKRKIQDPDELRSDYFNQPFFFGYYGLNRHAFYTMIWPELLYESGLYVNNFDLVDEIGNIICTVGQNGFKANEYETFNLESEFVPPTNGDLIFYDNNEYSNILKSAGIIKE